MKKIIIILATVFFLLLVAVGVYVFVLAPRLNPPAAAVDGEQAGTPAPKKGKEPVLIKYELGEAFLSNVADSNRLFRVTVIIEAVDEKKTDEVKILDEKLEAMRDYVMEVLRNKEEKELRSADAMSNLRAQLVEDFKSKFDLPFITTIYFKDFVIQ